MVVNGFVHYSKEDERGKGSTIKSLGTKKRGTGTLPFLFP
jgi:hypothetical protein